MHPFTAIVLGLCGLAAAAAPRHSKKPYSQRMVESIMARKQGITYSSEPSTIDPGSILEAGMLAKALQLTASQYPQFKPRCAPYLQQVLEAISPSMWYGGMTLGLPIDRFSVANAIERANASGIIKFTENIRMAFQGISDSLGMQYRNMDDGFLHWPAWPQMSFIEDFFSIMPFLASRLSKVDWDMRIRNLWNPSELGPGTSEQLLGVTLQQQMLIHNSLLWERTYDYARGLPVQGYDASASAIWAKDEDSASPYAFGRSVGLYLLGLTDSWEVLDCTSARMRESQICLRLKTYAERTMMALVNYADPPTGAWLQLPAMSRVKGNFLESSSTALYIAVLLKAQRQGMLSTSAHYRNVALRAYSYTVDKFVTETGKGTIGFQGTVAECSLNSTASFEYYTSRPLVTNSLIGEAAFVLASLEVERLAMLDCLVKVKGNYHVC